MIVLSKHSTGLATYNNEDLPKKLGFGFCLAENWLKITLMSNYEVTTSIGGE